MVDQLFPGVMVVGNQVRIPKSALPRLESNPISAAQFFAAVLLRGSKYFPDTITTDQGVKLSVSQAHAYYTDPQSNRIAVLVRTEINLTTTNLKDL